MRPRLWAFFAILLAFAPAVRAESQPHWAYQPVRRPPLPSVKRVAWPRNAIDYFTLAKMEAAGLAPSNEAPAHRLLRRVSFDLTGLPPTLAEIERFARDRNADGYERVVDRLLHSPRYGERMATHWLDLARYADSHGYYVDSHRDMWRYRDEVIDAFNRHQPYDQFTIEQLAGDLLPGATLQQKIASGFNRNHMINFEPGAIPEEYQNEYVVDRVVTTATVWLGQTMQCAQCHDHKYDPFTMRDFYALAAFFNNVPEEGLDGRRGNAIPTIAAPTQEQQDALVQLKRQEDSLTTSLAARGMAAVNSQRDWERNLRAGKQKLPKPPADALAYLALDEEEGDRAKNLALPSRDSRYLAKIAGSPLWVGGKFNNGLLLDGETSIDAGDVGRFATGESFTLAAWAFATTDDRMTLLKRASTDKQDRGIELYFADGRLHLALRHKHPDEVLIVATKAKLRTSRWQHVAATYDGSGRPHGVKLYLEGQPQIVDVLRDQLAGGAIDANPPLRIGGTSDSAFRGMLDEIRVYGRTLSDGEIALLADSNPVMQLVAMRADQRSPQQQLQLSAFYLEHHDAAYRALLKQRGEVEHARRKILASSPTTMVMAEREERRPAFVLDRGDYRQPGEPVTAAIPAIFPPLPEGAAPNRLTLARWLVDGKHPLTARVAVNRLWQLHFGQGLVRTPEDFGTRGEFPSHPELLDWLTDELVTSGWNLQHIQRLIVTSATYRQDSTASPTRRSNDPTNVLLSWFPRQRLPAEMLRDQALAASELLSEAMHGPAVYPYQPPGLWEEIGLAGGEFSSQSYAPSRGADLYRRSLYTFWKRTSLAPNMAVFDASDRQVCTVARVVTNTPLQALVLWNDPLYVEAARQLATICLAARVDDEERMNLLFLRVLNRDATAAEAAVLHRLLVRQRDEYVKDTATAKRLLAVGDSPCNNAVPAAELAAWTCVAQAILTLDEAVSRN